MVPFSAKVKVWVTADGELKSLLSSFVTRELRTLPGVLVTDEQPEWELRIVAITVKNQGSREVGYALSTATLKRFGEAPIDFLERVGGLKTEFVPFLKKSTRDLYDVKELQVVIIPQSHLQRKCQELVAAFDTEYMEPARKEWQEIEELVRKTNP
jgi:hypothetical protein